MNKMTHDEMLKYSAELVVKNNPDEAVKLLIQLQKENELLRVRKTKAIEYIDNELLPFGDYWHWDNAGIEDLVVELRTKLRGEDNE